MAAAQLRAAAAAQLMAAADHSQVYSADHRISRDRDSLSFFDPLHFFSIYLTER
jgi:hypothetical protein